MNVIWQKSTPTDFRDGDIYLLRSRRTGNVWTATAATDPLYFMPAGYEGPVYLADYDGKVDWCLVWREE